MSPRIRRFLVLTVVLIALAAVGLVAWRHRILARQEAMAGPAIEEALKAGDFLSARAVLKRLPEPAQREEWEKKIRVGELEQGLKVRDADLLQLALGSDGGAWMDAGLRERAALVLARHAMQAKDTARYQELAAVWKDSKAFENQWYLLEADRLIGQGQREEAVAWLAGRKLEGKDDANRLARLALLQAKNPVTAWKSIESGLAIDPRNGDLLSFRAQLCEALGRVEEARQGYVAAVIAEPDNPLHRETLANFYRRLGRLADAADTWREAAEQTGLGVYAFKSWFWGRMAGAKTPPPACRQVWWNEVMGVLAALPPGAFTSVELESAMSRLSGAGQRHEMEWLKALEALRSGDAARIDEAMAGGFTPEAKALWPGLAERLKACVAASQGKDPRTVIAGADKLRPKGDEHVFVRDFLSWVAGDLEPAREKAFEALLARPDSAIGALLASGWQGAALDVAGGGRFAPAEGAPEWLVYGYAKSLQQREGVAAARAWLEKIAARGPAGDLLLGELRLADGAADEGTKLISQVAGGGSEHAGRARWTLAMAALQKGDGAAARAAVGADPELSASPHGQEILARAALLEGQREEATAIYRRIVADSADAMIFLSKEAFAAGRYDEAQQLTAKLVERFPEEPQFRRNLAKIEELRKAAKP